MINETFGTSISRGLHWDGTSLLNKLRNVEALYNIASEKIMEQMIDGGSNGANSIAQTDED